MPKITIDVNKVLLDAIDLHCRNLRTNRNSFIETLLRDAVRMELSHLHIVPAPDDKSKSTWDSPEA